MRAVRAEWSKLWSVRSTWVALGVAVTLTFGLGLADTISTVRGWATMPAADRAAFDPLASAFAGLTFAQLALGVLGVLAVTSEYSSGTIVAALTAQPRRAVVFAAKAATVYAVSLLAGEALAFGSYLLGQAILHGKHLDVGLGAPGVLRSVAGAGLYLCVVTMVGLGLGAFLRNPAAATAALIAVVFLAYGAAKAVEGWSYLPSRLLLSNAGDVVAQVHAVAAKPRLPSLGLAYLDLALYLAAAVGLGIWRSTRDV
ncbi:ABC transporter permease subunit [Actinoplanes sp. KI2]|uniref:ABC transporter permease subunit n=1 Tax=Actinoplanes sp. KI2 TaxID=2983315 RepID=UPI0021D5AFB8|nr:ABC transporter permease subunit [Actinoplanes sp. KI2]MCU7729681.1 ABC transporter permease subunit [Actinoplanes sp. KI2]